jgi:hypothetical protein
MENEYIIWHTGWGCLTAVLGVAATCFIAFWLLGNSWVFAVLFFVGLTATYWGAYVVDQRMVRRRRAKK